MYLYIFGFQMFCLSVPEELMQENESTLWSVIFIIKTVWNVIWLLFQLHCLNVSFFLMRFKKKKINNIKLLAFLSIIYIFFLLVDWTNFNNLLLHFFSMKSTQMGLLFKSKIENWYPINIEESHSILTNDDFFTSIINQILVLNTSLNQIFTFINHNKWQYDIHHVHVYG